MTPTSGASFGDRLHAVFGSRGRLCVGIDPHAGLLRDWNLQDSALGAREFGLRVVDAAQQHAGIVKPQVAFFERFGAAGYTALETVIAHAREAGLLVIADAKRGDIGSSVEAYGDAWLGAGSPLESDAMTVSAFQGVASIANIMQHAEANGKGLFVLAATSNPEAAQIQTAIVGGDAVHRTVSRAIIEDVTAFNSGQPGHALGSIGVVIGATLDLERSGIDTGSVPDLNRYPILAPGFGHQGAAVADAKAVFGALASSIIVSESRSLLRAGADGIAKAIRARAAEVSDALG